MRAICLIIITSLMFAGCAINNRSGNQAMLNFQPETGIIKGKTTKTELLEKLGPPQSTQKRSVAPDMRDNPNIPPMAKAPETWMYWSSNMEGTTVILPFVSSMNTRMMTNTLAIYMDENGTVFDYSTTSSGM